MNLRLNALQETSQHLSECLDLKYNVHLIIIAVNNQIMKLFKSMTKQNAPHPSISPIILGLEYSTRIDDN